MQEGLFVLEIDVANGISESEKNELQAYPSITNPGGRVYLDLQDQFQNTRAEIWSLSGALVSNQQLNNTSGSITHVDLPTDIEAGMYVLRIFANENSKATKIIVR